MELCVKQLEERYLSSDSGEEVIIRLNILSQSILTLKDFVDRIKRHSQIIHLTEKPCKVTDLLTDAASIKKLSGISIRIEIPDDLFLVCDKVHITEVFTNIITNAIEAIRENGIIEITGVYEKSKYRLMIKDNGEGIDPRILNDVFNPHFSTKKSMEKNYGLGLYYCKNVMAAHGGSILAKSVKGKETTIILTFSSKRVAIGSQSG
jgi:signal transduction histidine kinase